MRVCATVLHISKWLSFDHKSRYLHVNDARFPCYSSNPKLFRRSDLSFYETTIYCYVKKSNLFWKFKMIKWKGLDFFLIFAKKKSKIFENFDTIPWKKYFCFFIETLSPLSDHQITSTQYYCYLSELFWITGSKSRSDHQTTDCATGVIEFKNFDITSRDSRLCVRVELEFRSSHSKFKRLGTP